MNRKCLVLCAVALLAVACGAVQADWTASDLYAVNGDHLTLTPTYTPITGGFAYSYNLANMTTTDNIVGFTLIIPWVVDVESFTDIVTPAGWNPKLSHYEQEGVQINRINWRALTDPVAIEPGGSKTFGFTSVFGPSAQQEASASSIDQQGYSGTTFTPIPEPASFASLMVGLMGLVSLRLRRK